MEGGMGRVDGKREGEGRREEGEGRERERREEGEGRKEGGECPPGLATILGKTWNPHYDDGVLLPSMCSQPVSFRHTFPSPNTSRCRSSLRHPASCSSVVWRLRRPLGGRPASVTSRKSMTRWTPKSGNSLKRRG